MLRSLVETMNRPVVYCFINRTKKRVFIVSTANFLPSLARHVTQLATNSHPNRDLQRARKRLKVEIIDRFNDPSLCELKRSVYEERFLKEGYTVYNKKRKANYKVRIGLGNTGYLQVQIVSAGKRIWAVKEFKTIEDAEQFIKDHTLEQIVCMTKTRIV